MAELQASRLLRRSPEQVWAAISEPAGQGVWMPATEVKATRGDGTRPGDRIDARTGWRWFGFTDVMVVTEVDPPRRWQVRHVGRLVRGAGVFELTAQPGGTELVWSEFVLPPFGLAGQLAALLAGPLLQATMRRCLDRLACHLQ